MEGKGESWTGGGKATDRVVGRPWTGGGKALDRWWEGLGQGDGKALDRVVGRAQHMNYYYLHHPQMYTFTTTITLTCTPTTTITLTCTPTTTFTLIQGAQSVNNTDSCPQISAPSLTSNSQYLIHTGTTSQLVLNGKNLQLFGNNLRCLATAKGSTIFNTSASVSPSGDTINCSQSSNVGVAYCLSALLLW